MKNWKKDEQEVILLKDGGGEDSTDGQEKKPEVDLYAQPGRSI